MATFRFEINKKRPTRNKTFIVWLRITTDGKRKLLKTDIELKSANDFNSKARQDNWIRPSEPNSAKWNNDLADILEKTKDTYKDLKKTGVATSENIASTIKSEEISPSFLQYAKQRTTDILNEGGHRNFKKYNGFCNKLEGYLKSIKKRDLLFAELTSSFLSRFEAYLHSLKNERNPDAKLHPNTIAINLNIFKTIINRAVEVDRLIKPEQNPFLGYKYSREISTTKEKLNEKETRISFKPNAFASTLPKPHEPTLKPKLCQRACKANAPREIVLKNLPTLNKNKKTLTHEPTEKKK